MSPPLNWGDIGYNMVICSDGTIEYGRDIYYSGSHDPGKAPDGSGYTMNQRAFAISCIGNFMEDTMTEKQFQGLVKGTLWAMNKFGLSIGDLHKHKDQYATDCPGDNFPWNRLISEVGKGLKGSGGVKKVVVYYSSDDYSVALIASNKNGGIAMFNRNRGATVHADAMAADKVINIGGPKLGHKNEVYWSGEHAEDTALIVLNGLKGVY